MPLKLSVLQGVSITTDTLAYTHMHGDTQDAVLKVSGLTALHMSGTAVTQAIQPLAHCRPPMPWAAARRGAQCQLVAAAQSSACKSPHTINRFAIMQESVWQVTNTIN